MNLRYRYIMRSQGEIRLPAFNGWVWISPVSKAHSAKNPTAKPSQLARERIEHCKTSQSGNFTFMLILQSIPHAKELSKWRLLMVNIMGRLDECRRMKNELPFSLSLA